MARIKEEDMRLRLVVEGGNAVRKAMADLKDNIAGVENSLKSLTRQRSPLFLEKLCHVSAQRQAGPLCVIHDLFFQLRRQSNRQCYLLFFRCDLRPSCARAKPAADSYF